MIGDFIGGSGKTMYKCPTRLMKKSIPKSVIFLFITPLFYQISRVMERKRNLVPPIFF
jgi:hypothetical protein